MGIRIHKQLGYGLTDIHEKIETEDTPLAEVELVEQINWDSPLLKYKEEEMSLDNYLDWLDEHSEDDHDIELAMLRERLNQYDHFKANTDYKRLQVPNPRGYSRRPLKAVTRGEGSLKGLLCITPVWLLDDWLRWDDAIDWIEETYFPKPGIDPQTSYVKILDEGIFPYSGLWMHAQTGERLSGDQIRHWKIMDNHYKEHLDKFDDEAQLSLDIWANAAGFDDHADAVANCVPLVPEEIRHLCAFGELFTTDEVWMQLRPMLYVYWS